MGDACLLVVLCPVFGVIQFDLLPSLERYGKRFWSHSRVGFRRMVDRRMGASALVEISFNRYKRKCWKATWPPTHQSKVSYSFWREPLRFCMDSSVSLLPHTPPSKQSANPWVFVDALKLFKDKNFAIFMFISFVVSTQLMFFFIQTPMLLESAKVGINPDNTSAVLTTFCISTEILAMFVLMPWSLKKFGIGKTLAIGVLAWPIRYAIFSLGTPWWLVVGSLLLHGLAYTFFFVVGQIYVDRVAPVDIKRFRTKSIDHRHIRFRDGDRQLF